MITITRSATNTVFIATVVIFQRRKVSKYNFEVLYLRILIYSYFIFKLHCDSDAKWSRGCFFYFREGSEYLSFVACGILRV